MPLTEIFEAFYEKKFFSVTKFLNNILVEVNKQHFSITKSLRHFWLTHNSTLNLHFTYSPYQNIKEDENTQLSYYEIKGLRLYHVVWWGKDCLNSLFIPVKI